MRIPSGMTEEQVINTVDDIKQEAFIICIEALNRYEEGRPLENFLSVNLSNRLKTFMRDNYFTGSSNEKRKKVFQPAQLDYEDHIIDDKGLFSNSYDGLDMKEMINTVSDGNT